MNKIVDWETWLKEQEKEKYYKRLENNLLKEMKNYVLYPNFLDIYRAFDITNFENIKVVVVGDFPYENPHEADGLAFSSIYRFPKALYNIYRRIEDELRIVCDTSNNDLAKWSRQGVFLLNAVLTTRAGVPGSHVGVVGWEELTTRALRVLYYDDKPKVFILLGRLANQCFRAAAYPVNNNHLILTGAEPTSRYFHRQSYFKATNDFIKRHYNVEIDWC